MKMKSFFAAIVMALVFCGCHSDQYYHERATERAREYVLKNSRDLTSEQINYIRFNAPFLLHSPVLKAGTPLKIETAVAIEQHQVCIGWILPGREDVLMVFGVSTGRMDDWYPNRIISRDYKHQKPFMVDTAQKCVAYAQRNLFHMMNTAEINKLRFTFPFLIQTNFGLNIDPDSKLTEKKYEELQKKYADMTEYSIVWKLDSRNLIFAGYDNDEFKKWQIVSVDFVSNDELAKHTVKELMTPADVLKPFPVPSEKKEAVQTGNQSAAEIEQKPAAKTGKKSSARTETTPPVLVKKSIKKSVKK